MFLASSMMLLNTSLALMFIYYTLKSVVQIHSQYRYQTSEPESI